jgi:predicted enzyme related to lactoylglutathione lyase
VKHAIVWTDIPARDLDRAIRFYSAVLGAEVKKQDFPELSIGVLPHADGEVGACLFASETARPSADGPLVYLSCEGRLDAAEAAVVPHGGKVLQPKHGIAPYGFRSIVLDSEGNRIALHSG